MAHNAEELKKKISRLKLIHSEYVTGQIEIENEIRETEDELNKILQKNADAGRN
jgi:hypothetical protein